MDVVEVSGLRIAFRRRGDGPSLVLLHGGLCDGRVWGHELASLSDAYTVVAWDAPGCGGSSDPPATFRMPEYAECLGGFLDALALAPAHVVGHSWGSTLALALARQRPDAVRSLVLIGAYAGWAGSLPPGEVDARLQLALRTAALPVDELDPASVPGLFSDAMPADRAEDLRRMMTETRRVGTETMAYAMAEADLHDDLERIEVPTLVLAGDADQRSPLSVARALHAAIPGSMLTVLPGLGHESFLEAPETVDAEVRAFLATSP